MISTRGPFLLTLEYVRCVSADDEIDNLSRSRPLTTAFGLRVFLVTVGLNLSGGKISLSAEPLIGLEPATHQPITFLHMSGVA